MALFMASKMEKRKKKEAPYLYLVHLVSYRKEEKSHLCPSCLTPFNGRCEFMKILYGRAHSSLYPYNSGVLSSPQRLDESTRLW